MSFLQISWGGISCVPSSFPWPACPGGSVGDSHSLQRVVHCSPPPQPLGGPEHRSRRVPPTAVLCGGFGSFTSAAGRSSLPAALARRAPTAGVRPGGARQHVLPARPGAVLVGDTRALSLPVHARAPLLARLGSWLVRLCFQALLSTVGWQLAVFRVGRGAPRRRAGPRASRLAPKGAPRRLGSDPDLVSRGAAVPARRRPGRRCCVTSGFKRTSDGQVFGY